MDTGESFERLVQSVALEITSLKQKVIVSTNKGETRTAKELLDKIELAQKIIDEVIRLRESWEREFPVISTKTLEEENERTKDPTKEMLMEKADPENPSIKIYSSQSDFYIPILQSMVELGGGRSKNDVIEKVKEIISRSGGKLDETVRDYYYQKNIVWKENIRNAFVSLEKKGYTNRYHITEEGKKHLDSLI